MVLRILVNLDPRIEFVTRLKPHNASSLHKTKIGYIKISKDSIKKKEEHKNKREKQDKFF
jgi:hypothetical protein